MDLPFTEKIREEEILVWGDDKNQAFIFGYI